MQMFIIGCLIFNLEKFAITYKNTLSMYYKCGRKYFPLSKRSHMAKKKTIPALEEKEKTQI